MKNSKTVCDPEFCTRANCDREFCDQQCDQEVCDREVCDQEVCDREIDWMELGWDVVLERYKNLKNKLSNTLLLYKVGTLYYAFEDDALVLCLELKQKLFKTQTTVKEVKTISITEEAMNEKIPQLLEDGYTIAIYDRPCHRVISSR